MKKTVFIVLLGATMLTSCYTYTTVVGRGAQGGDKVIQWNSYLIDGLVPIKVSDPKTMAGGATDYTVVVKHSFVNGLIAGITFGIYSPTTTTVTK